MFIISYVYVWQFLPKKKLAKKGKAGLKSGRTKCLEGMYGSWLTFS